MAKYNKEYYEKYKDSINKASKNYYHRNKEEMSNKALQYYHNNKEMSKIKRKNRQRLNSIMYQRINDLILLKEQIDAIKQYMNNLPDESSEKDGVGQQIVTHSIHYVSKINELLEKVKLYKDGEDFED